MNRFAVIGTRTFGLGTTFIVRVDAVKKMKANCRIKWLAPLVQAASLREEFCEPLQRSLAREPSVLVRVGSFKK